MATWTTITDASLEPGKPAFSVTALAFRDNPIAISEGAAGAPKIQNAAMDDNTVDDRLLTGTATTVGRDWVLARTALAGVGSVGTYGLFYKTTSGSISSGNTIAGSALNYSNSDASSRVGSPSGTWRAMGIADGGLSNGASVTVFLRIA